LGHRPKIPIYPPYGKGEAEERNPPDDPNFLDICEDEEIY